MRTTTTIAFLLICCAAESVAQTSRQAGAFLDIGLDAATAGVGHAGSSSAVGVRAMAWNVANLADATSLELTASYVDQLEQVTFEYAALAIPFIRGKSVLGAAVSTTGDEALTEWTVHLAWAYRLDWLRMGAGVRFRRATFGRNVLNPDDFVVFDPVEIADGLARKVYGSANGGGIDAGLSIQAHRDIRLSMALRNVYAPVYWQSESGVQQRRTRVEHVPMDMDVSLHYSAAEWITFHAAWAPATAEDVAARYGFGASLQPVYPLILRAGRYLLHDGFRNESTTLGFGLRVRDIWGVGIGMDYAYVTSSLATSQLLTLVIAP